MGWGHGARCTAISALQERDHIVGGPAALPHPDQGSGQRSHHLMDERTRPRAEPEHSSMASPAELPQTTLGASPLGNPAEGREVVLAYQVPAGLVHRRDVQVAGMVQCRCGQPRVLYGRLENRVHIGSRSSAEPGMPVVGLTDHAVDRDRRTAQSVERHTQPNEVGVVRHTRDPHNLSEGMHPRIGAPRPLGLEGISEHPLQGRFELSLDGRDPCLTSPSVKGRAVVGDVQAQVQLLPSSA